MGIVAPLNTLPDYAELHCLSAFSFLRGASSALELFERAAGLGYRALAITDECSLSGIVRALEASRKTGLALIVGSEFRCVEGLRIVLLAENLAGYQALCALITRARRRAVKGTYEIHREDLAGLDGLLCLWLADAEPEVDDAQWLQQHFRGRLWLAIELHRGARDAKRLTRQLAFCEEHEIPAVASGDVHMHVRSRRRLQDTITAIRQRTTIAEAGAHLFPNGERHLRSREALAAIYPRQLLDETLRITERCQFHLDNLNYQYPQELVPTDETPISHLRKLTYAGAALRWREGLPAAMTQQIEHELRLIETQAYEAFFLTVHDIVRFARSQHILCQGRGSSANSIVCYCLHITEVDPRRVQMLFERFISIERDEPPDIDVDFEHERREEVIQYIYAKYGRERTALAATVICYRGRSALRDVARALGLGSDQVEELSRCISHHDSADALDERLRERGFDPAAKVIQQLIALTRQLIGMPRHLSQHVGGFVISGQPLSLLVPIENAAMAERTIIQWDKDDLETMRLLKVDCLALGMLTCIRKCLDLLRDSDRRDLSLADIAATDRSDDDSARRTWDMICKADTLGVFQIESRAQMAMLPRLKPRSYYDLVVQVAIVRPGPIQGDMVHPYLKRRQDPSLVDYPSAELEPVLKRTLGVPLFQEQVMQLAITAAGFSPGEADQLRRGMAAWKRRGGLEYFHDRFVNGMLGKGYDSEFAERLFNQLRGFGSYGFPESHAASFALLTWFSCWLKCNEPSAFACALLNAQPLGFYAPSQIIQDLRRHGGIVSPVDVRFSEWDCSLDPCPRDQQPALRLGLREVRGLAEARARAIVEARRQSAFRDIQDLAERAGLDHGSLARLAEADALRGLAGHRHRARWQVAGVEKQLPLFDGISTDEDAIRLRPPTPRETVIADYAATGLSLGPHPLALLRKQLKARRCTAARDLEQVGHGRTIRVAGLVTLRQRPQTAAGVTFLTLEDESGLFNIVVWQRIAERQRRVLLESRLLSVSGRLECVDGVQHIIAERLEDYTQLFDALDSRSRDFR
ncbi:MAG TPA: error-prone DNA polymerase [Dokdonella sp.]|uniref:error-prone DNA polymerase n=1 Tax=Dokdonella sp. TaxID=2291710 RepID=UPI002D8010A3|nr:error-prone DNA polymerase [Dokdonella sp.]HET9033666.1 error-prone DNA polymerase [Dokdonella sp.]